ncbi:MAG: aminopeptidase [Proteobacteria bacterium]|nr:aminopeptidase [Pseudomonadota bacterium]
MRILHLFSLLLLIPALTACGTLQYYSQSISGQLSLLMKREDIGDLIQDDKIDASTRQKLQRVLTIRRFASEQLQLPDNDSYTSYADLGRPFAVWNVFAAPALSIKPKTWCFPVAGCVPYRGYFKREAALAYAKSLKAEGYDVYVGGISAYSTLGWFDDPVLNTILKRPEPQLAGLLFHELAHQKLYIKDDSTFNESFATAVELEGVRRWLEQANNLDGFKKYQLRKQRQAQFIRLVMGTRDELAALYSSDKPDAEKIKHKPLIFSSMRQRYAELKKQWNDNSYDGWFKRALNNARIATIGTYHDHVPAFQTMLAEAKGDMAVFYADVEKLSRHDKKQRDKILAAKSRNNKPQIKRMVLLDKQ